MAALPRAPAADVGAGRRTVLALAGALLAAGVDSDCLRSPSPLSRCEVADASLVGLAMVASVPLVVFSVGLPGTERVWFYLRHNEVGDDGAALVPTEDEERQLTNANWNQNDGW